MGVRAGISVVKWHLRCLGVGSESDEDSVDELVCANGEG